MRKRLVPALRICALAVAIAWLLWLVLANAWLNLGLLDEPFLSMHDAEIRVGPAFSWWPGQVRGRNLRVVVRDSSVEMDLRIDRFDLALSMRELTGKRLHTTRTDLRGVSLRIRGTRFLQELCSQPPGLPPIFGQALPRTTSEQECLAQAETARPKGPPPPIGELFHLQLENLDVTGFHEIWIETYRLEGDAELQGMWSFWPKKEIRIELRRFQAHEARLAQGTRRLVRNLDLELAGTLDPLPLIDVDSKQLWKAISARATLRFQDLELKAIRGALLAANPIAPPRLPGLDGLANLEAGLRLDSGQVKSFSLDAQARQAAIELLDRRLAGALRLRAQMAQDADRPGRLLVTGTQLTITQPRLEHDGETQAFDDTAIAVDGVGAGHLDPEHQRMDLAFSAAVSRVKFVIALIPGGLPRSIARLLLGDDAPATAKGTLHATSHGAEVREFHAGAGGLTLDGGFAFAPRLDGKLTAKYGVISADIPLH